MLSFEETTEMYIWNNVYYCVAAGNKIRDVLLDFDAAAFILPFFLMFFLLVVCIDFADWTCEKWNKITEYSNINIHKYTK